MVQPSKAFTRNTFSKSLALTWSTTKLRSRSTGRQLEAQPRIVPFALCSQAAFRDRLGRIPDNSYRFSPITSPCRAAFRSFAGGQGGRAAGVGRWRLRDRRGRSRRRAGGPCPRGCGRARAPPGRPPPPTVRPRHRSARCNTGAAAHHGLRGHPLGNSLRSQSSSLSVGPLPAVSCRLRASAVAAPRSRFSLVSVAPGEARTPHPPGSRPRRRAASCRSGPGPWRLATPRRTSRAPPSPIGCIGSRGSPGGI